MKKMLSLLFAFLLFSSTLFSEQWKILDSLNSVKYHDRWMEWADSLHGAWLATTLYYEHGGIIRLTSNGGNSWETVLADTINPNNLIFFPRFNSFCFRDKNLLLLACDSGQVRRSSDLGKNWETITIRDGWFVDVIDMYDETSGYLRIFDENDNIHFFTTADGGINWEEKEIPQEFRFLWYNRNSITAYNNFFLGSDENGPALIKIARDFSLWEKFALPVLSNDLKMYQYSDIHFFDENRGCLIGYTAKFNGKFDNYTFTTNDGGESWKIVKTGDETPMHIKNFSFIDNNIAFASTNEHSLLSTSNGGNSWKEMNLTELYNSRGYFSFSFLKAFKTSIKLLSGKNHIIEVIPEPTGIDDHYDNAKKCINVCPEFSGNPDNIILEYQSIKPGSQFLITDISGRTIAEKIITNESGSISIGSIIRNILPAGIYIIRIENINESDYEKFMIIR